MLQFFRFGVKLCRTIIDMCCIKFAGVFMAMVLNLASPGVASADIEPEVECLQAARIAARENGIPFRILAAITLVETGREIDGVLRSWPWALNNAGKGYWRKTMSDAISLAQRFMQNRETNIDVGCFQLNMKWHAESFSSLDAMFDPLKNANYAALFLKRLYREHGTWLAAAGAYHSRNEKYAARYRIKFADLLNAIDRNPAFVQLVDMASLAASQSAPKPNSFPLLMSTDGYSGVGSLVPVLEPHFSSLIKVN